MRPYFLALAATVLAGVHAASAQGILSLQNNSDFREQKPMSFSIGVGGGYDDMQQKGSSQSSIESGFLQGSLGATFSDHDKITPWDLGLDLGILDYLHHTSGVADQDYTGRVVFNISHQVNQRLTIKDNFYATYETEPNFGIGATTSGRNGQYFYGYNNFAVSYAWSDRFSTTTSYTVDGIKYQESLIAHLEDRLSHLFAQQFSWSSSPTLKLVGEYRFGMVNYNNSSANYMTHYALAGIDKAWSSRTTASVRAGAEFYESDRGNSTAPYFEASLSHSVTKKTTLTLYSTVGYDPSELDNFQSRYSYRVGASAAHRLTDRLTLNGDINYVYSTFNGVGSSSNVMEHDFSISAGVGYRFYDNISLNANYSYSIVSSDDITREYDRNRVSLGVNATF